jgi:hypothetical protein
VDGRSDEVPDLDVLDGGPDGNDLSCRIATDD